MTIDTTQPKREFLENIDIHELLPQQEPFVMVGKLVHFDMQLTTTTTLVKDDNVFVENGYMTAEGLIIIPSFIVFLHLEGG